jgi:hypothetical protein
MREVEHVAVVGYAQDGRAARPKERPFWSGGQQFRASSHHLDHARYADCWLLLDAV